MNTDKKKEMHITPLTIFEVQKLLNYLAKNGSYMASIDNLNMKFKGIVEDTINGKREMFYLERKITDEDNHIPRID